MVTCSLASMMPSRPDDLARARFMRTLGRRARKRKAGGRPDECCTGSSQLRPVRMPRQNALIAPKARVLASAGGALPAEFCEPVVVNTEMVGDLMDDGPADLVRDLLPGLADGADRRAIDGDPVGEDTRIIRRTAGQRMPS